MTWSTPKTSLPPADNGVVPWSAPPTPQLSIAASRFAPFAEQQEQQLQRFTALMTEELVK